MTRVLVVDDEPPIVRAVAANLRVRGCEVLTASRGEAALTAVETHQPDCVVLDLGLPGIDGLEVLRRLRTWTQIPVVVLTAIDSERDKVTALDLGADDYVTKPFGVAELMARVRVALRHGARTGADRPQVVHAGEVAIDGQHADLVVLFAANRHSNLHSPAYRRGVRSCGAQRLL